MKTRYAVALAVATSFGLGAVSVYGVHAQTKPQVYVINEIEVTDPAAFKTYGERQEVLIKKHGGRFIVREGKVSEVEGKPPRRTAVTLFDSVEKYQAWRDEPEQKELKVMRDKASKFRAYAVEGLAN
jgi:uncharacterized protein (DUF1330 family)